MTPYEHAIPAVFFLGVPGGCQHALRCLAHLEEGLVVENRFLLQLGVKFLEKRSRLFLFGFTCGAFCHYFITNRII